MRSRYALLHPRFVLLACGQATSSLGNGVFPVAIAFLVLERGSATDLAVVLAADGVGLIVVIAGAGLLADRLPRIGLMVAADVLRLAATGAMAVVPSRASWLVPLAFLMGAGEALFAPSYKAILPMVLGGGDRLAAANAALATARRVSSLCGTFLGGVLVATVGARAALGADALTFGVSVVSLGAIRVGAGRAPRRRPLLVDAAEGVRAVTSRPWLWSVIALASVQGAFAHGPVTVVLPVVVHDRFGNGLSLSAVYAAETIGLIGGGLLAGAWKPGRPGYVVVAGLASNALVAAAVVAAAPLAVLVAANCLFGAGVGAMQVVWNSALQRNVPDDVLGRVVAVDYLGSDGLTPIGTALTGPVVDRAGANPVMLAAIAVIAVTSAAVVRVPEAMSLGHSAGDERPARQASPRAKA